MSTPLSEAEIDLLLTCPDCESIIGNTCRCLNTELPTRRDRQLVGWLDLVGQQVAAAPDPADYEDLD